MARRLGSSRAITHAETGYVEVCLIRANLVELCHIGMPETPRLSKAYFSHYKQRRINHIE